MSLNPRGILTLVLLCSSYFFVNFFLRWPAFEQAFYLNEDAALILYAKRLDGFKALVDQLFRGYGPDIIRPLQIVGMAIEHFCLGLQVREMLIMGLFYLSISQTILLLTAGPIKAWKYLLVGLIGLSPLSAEPTLWLSARHDLYLFFAFVVLLALVNQAFKSKIVFNLMYSFTLWTAFWSNEKALVLPLIVPAIYSLSEKKDKKLKSLLLTGLINLFIYSIYRFLVLGKLVGGYEDRVLANENFKEFFLSWVFKVISLPVWQGEANYSLSAFITGLILIGAVFIYGFLSANSLKAKSKQLSLFIIIQILAILPTARYALTLPLHELLNSRWLWLPFVTLLVSSLFFCREPGSGKSRLIFNFAVVSLTLSSSFFFFQVSKKYAAVQRLSSDAVSSFAQNCTCYLKTDRQSEGLWPVVYGVNAFSEAAFLPKTAALISGIQVCPSKEAACSMHFRMRSTKTFDYMLNRPDKALIDKLNKSKFKSETQAKNKFNISKPKECFIENKKCVVGWARGKSFDVFDWIILRSVSGVIVYAAAPGVLRPDVSEPGLRYGFEVPVDYIEIGGQISGIKGNKEYIFKKFSRPITSQEP